LTPAPYNPADDLGLIDYYESLFEIPEVQITLESGDSITLRSAGLGASYYMEHLGRLIQDDPLEYRVGLFARWLRAAGVPDPVDLSLGDLVKVAMAVKGMNLPTGRMAWDLIPMEEDDDPASQPVDFIGRALTRVIHTLAQHYGWSIDRIIKLPREVAMAHLQECVLADRRTKEWTYSLSEVAWEYDKGAGVSRYRPLPDLPWEKGIPSRKREEEEIPEHIREKYWPKGVIIDLQDQPGLKRNGDGRPHDKQ
jgi:hypothetical protein